MTTEPILLDLNHPIEAGMETYPGLPGPDIREHLSREDSAAHYAPGASFAIASITMVANTGTYIDAPFHRFEDGADFAELPLTSLANLEGVRASVSPDSSERRIEPAVFRGLDLAGKAVLIAAGWSVRFRQPDW